jgi:hypothetical protein
LKLLSATQVLKRKILMLNIQNGLKIWWSFSIEIIKSKIFLPLTWARPLLLLCKVTPTSTGNIKLINTVIFGKNSQLTSTCTKQRSFQLKNWGNIRK